MKSLIITLSLFVFLSLFTLIGAASSADNSSTNSSKIHATRQGEELDCNRNSKDCFAKNNSTAEKYEDSIKKDNIKITKPGKQN